jgi:hypothetical protein
MALDKRQDGFFYFPDFNLLATQMKDNTNGTWIGNRRLSIGCWPVILIARKPLAIPE